MNGTAGMINEWCNAQTQNLKPESLGPFKGFSDRVSKCSEFLTTMSVVVPLAFGILSLNHGKPKKPSR